MRVLVEGPMRDVFDSAIKEHFDKLDESGTSKLMPLSEAIRMAVRPGMAIHTGITHVFSYAAINEVIRRFWKTDPKFTLLALSGRIHGINMIRGGMVKRIVATFNGDVYPSPGPNPVFQKSYLDGSVEYENWSVLTLPMRFKAAAMGLSCITTRSIIGSSMERDNRDSFAVIDDPFEPGGRLGLLCALYPDISIYHAAATDVYGNALFTPPYGENLWGAMAAREGVIITAEKIVSTDFIRRHSHFVILPGCYVKSVSHVPFGGHPGGLHAHSVEDVESYAEDYDFVEEFKNVTRDEAKLDAWIDKWILSVKDYDDYTRKVGYEKVLFLKGKSRSDAWRHEIVSKLDFVDAGAEWNQMERMVVVGSRRLAAKIESNGYKTILAGIGASNLAAWLAADALKRKGVEIELVAELGFYGYSPRPADPFIFNHANLPTCKSITDVFDALGVFTCGAENKCIGALGAAQVDKHGNINSTMIPGKMYLTGSGGANDVLAGARDVLLVCPHGKTRFVEKVPYITGNGKNVTTLVSTLGVFEKLNGEDTFTLTTVFGGAGGVSLEERLEIIKKNCGWELKVAPDLREEPPPSIDELRLLRLFDPDRHFTEST